MTTSNVWRARNFAAALSALLLFTALPPPAHAQQDVPPLRIGSHAPAFITKTVNGNPISLKSLRGHVVLLDFWATWCEPCREAIPTLRALDRKFQKRGLRVVGISMDDTDTTKDVKPFLAKQGIKYAVADDPKADAATAAAYKVAPLPTQYLIDKKGIVRWGQIGFSRDEQNTLSRLIRKLLVE